MNVRVEPSLPDDLVRAVVDVKKAAAEAERTQRVAAHKTRALVARMRGDGMTVREVGAVLGISPQRVSQLAATKAKTVRPFTYVELATLIRAGDDPHFLVRQLREVVLRSGSETDPAAIDEIHGEPPPTGSVGWDAVLGGVASMTGRDRVSSPKLLDWCFDPARYVVGDIFDPLDSGKYFWLDYLRTPVELKVRNVVLPHGNLEGL